MSQIRLYIDEDSQSRALVLSLQERGVDVETVLTMNRRGFTDEEQLIWATQQGRSLYSANVGDFYSLHTQFLSEGRAHAGLILNPNQNFSVGVQMKAILKLIATKSAEDMINQVEFITKWLDQLFLATKLL